MENRRTILLLIDVEPDARKTSTTGDGWESSNIALDHLERLRGELESATGSKVTFNWFVRGDPQIAATWGSANHVAEGFPRMLKAIERHGDYAAPHVHLWRWSNAHRTWFNDFLDSSWVEECVETGLESFRNLFGEAAESFRFGDRWIDNGAVALLRRHGIRYDLTVEPGLPGGAIHDDPHARGTLPDFRTAPREPWIPSEPDYLVPETSGRGDMWMVPLTTTPPAWRIVRRSPWLMVGSRSPNLVLNPSRLWSHLQRELDRPATAPLAVVFRSGDLGKKPFLRNFKRVMGLVARHPALPFCEFTSVADAMSRWRTTTGTPA